MRLSEVTVTSLSNVLIFKLVTVTLHLKKATVGETLLIELGSVFKLDSYIPG
jgi:hypothetical protein